MLEEYLKQFFQHLRYERNVSQHTLRNYSSDLEQFRDHLLAKEKLSDIAVAEIDHLTIREWMASLHGDHKKTSVARKLASLRTFFQFLVREGVQENNPAKLVATPKVERKLPTHLSMEDAVRFIETPDLNTDLGRRDRAILEFLYATGMRVGELVNLSLKDIDFREKLVRVTGKRKKQRILPFGEPALQALMFYLNETRATFLNNCPPESQRRAWRGSVEGILVDARIYAEPWGFAIEDVRVPVRFWHGIEDRAFAVRLAEAIANRFPNCKARFIQDEGHYSLPIRHMREILEDLISV